MCGAISNEQCALSVFKKEKLSLAALKTGKMPTRPTVRLVNAACWWWSWRRWRSGVTQYSSLHEDSHSATDQQWIKTNFSLSSCGCLQTYHSSSWDPVQWCVSFFVHRNALFSSLVCMSESAHAGVIFELAWCYRVVDSVASHFAFFPCFPLVRSAASRCRWRGIPK